MPDQTDQHVQSVPRLIQDAKRWLTMAGDEWLWVERLELLYQVKTAVSQAIKQMETTRTTDGL